MRAQINVKQDEYGVALLDWFMIPKRDIATKTSTALRICRMTRSFKSVMEDSGFVLGEIGIPVCRRQDQV